MHHLALANRSDLLMKPVWLLRTLNMPVPEELVSMARGTAARPSSAVMSHRLGKRPLPQGSAPAPPRSG